MIEVQKLMFDALPSQQPGTCGAAHHSPNLVSPGSEAHRHPPAKIATANNYPVSIQGFIPQ